MQRHAFGLGLVGMSLTMVESRAFFHRKGLTILRLHNNTTPADRLTVHHSPLEPVWTGNFLRISGEVSLLSPAVERLDLPLASRLFTQ